MAYERDMGRSRGAGAIAAWDDVSSTARTRQQRLGLATLQRDRRMAAIARGSLGALSSGSSTFSSGGATPAPPATPVMIATMTGPSSIFRVPVPVVAPAPAPPPVFAAPATPIVAPPAAIIPPLPTDPTTTPPADGPSMTADPSTGLIPSGPTGTPTLQPIAIIAPMPPLPPDPTPDAPAAGTDNTTRNLLIAGGVAVAAYLLFVRKKGV